MSLLDSIIEAAPRIIREEHNVNNINWLRGLSDPGEMIRCGYMPQARRLANETDDAYLARLQATLTPAEMAELQTTALPAAIRRASLDTSNGRVNMFAAGELPWTSLGVLVDKAVNSEQAIKLAGLDWEVIKKVLGYTWTDAQGYVHHKPIHDAFAIVRTDTGEALGTVGSRYAPIQNRESFQLMDGALEQYGARYESAGSLFGGHKIWLLAHMPKQAFQLNGGDKVEPYVVFTNCHDGSGAAWCYPTSVRVVCNNTFRVSAKDKHKGLSIRHTGNVRDKIRVAQETLGLAAEGFQEFKEAAEVMYHKPVNIQHYANDVLDAVMEVTQAQATAGADALAAALVVTEAQRELERKSFQRKIERREEVLEDILNRYESERNGVGNIRGTAWAAFNAVTEHADHAKVGRQSADRETRLSRRFESVLAGDGDELKQVAYQKALA